MCTRQNENRHPAYLLGTNVNIVPDSFLHAVGPYYISESPINSLQIILVMGLSDVLRYDHFSDKRLSP